MTRRGWIVAALGVVLLVAVGVGIFWFGWDWKALIGWRALVDYINPKNATGRKDAVQVYALFVAGLVAAITAAVGLVNIRLTRRNLKQQRDREARHAEQQRGFAQGTALQAYYEQIGKLLTEYDLRTTGREEIRQLARGQTLTVLQEIDRNGKGSLLTFLHGAGLIATENPAVALTGADLQGAILQRADLERAYLQEANLQGAILQGADLHSANLQGAHLLEADLHSAYLQDARLPGANLEYANLQEARLLGANFEYANLQGADLQGAFLKRAGLERADLTGADLQGADLQEAILQEANVTDQQLAVAEFLEGATMPDGQILKSDDNPDGPTFQEWIRNRASF